ncbi:12143_t:CDS:2, partial [Racocetra persica]
GEDYQRIIAEIEKNIPPNEMPHCVITHDETTLDANDDKKTGWTPESEQKLHPKGREQHLSYPEIPNRYVTEILEVGANHDSYWNIQLLAKQLKYAIDILEIALPNTIFVFGFDNSSSHSAFTEDVLVASRMNVKYDEKQPRMRLGQLPDSTPQEM